MAKGFDEQDPTDKLRMPNGEDVDPANESTSTSPYLIILSGRELGRVIPLSEGVTIVGRAEDTDVVLDGQGISRQHASFDRKTDGTVKVTDLNSTNGTWIESVRIQEHTLGHADRVRIGSVTVLKFNSRDGLEESVFNRLYESSTRDPGTGAFNRRALQETMVREIAWHRRNNKPLSLVLLDIDGFKSINDTHGHIVGDIVLSHVVEICQDGIRSEDYLARFGGDEFVCLLRQTSGSEALIVAERLRKTVEDSPACRVSGKKIVRVQVTVSIGVTTQNGEDLTKPEVFLDAADRNLYRAKELGRNRVSADEPAA